eukprot:2049587-Amphidinium_carterae.1
MTCAHHHTKELSIGLVGSLEGAQTILKTWVLQGKGIRIKADHMKAAMKAALLEQYRSGQCLPESELNKLAEIVGEADAPVVDLPDAGKKRKTKGRLLGRINEGVPEE